MVHQAKDLSTWITWEVITLNLPVGHDPGCGVMPKVCVPFSLVCTSVYHVFVVKSLILLRCIGLITRSSKVQILPPPPRISVTCRI